MQVLWRAVEKAIPDVRSRVEVEMVGTPLTQARFLRRDRGTYGGYGWVGNGAPGLCSHPSGRLLSMKLSRVSHTHNESNLTIPCYMPPILAKHIRCSVLRDTAQLCFGTLSAVARPLPSLTFTRSASWESSRSPLSLTTSPVACLG